MLISLIINFIIILPVFNKVNSIFKKIIKVDKGIKLRYNSLRKQKEVGKSQEFTRSIVERRL